MKAKGIFISSLLVIDTFLASYYFGLHSRTLKVIDPKLPPVQLSKESSNTDTKDKKAEGANDAASSSTGKVEDKGKEKDSKETKTTSKSAKKNEAKKTKTKAKAKNLKPKTPPKSKQGKVEKSEKQLKRKGPY